MSNALTALRYGWVVPVFCFLIGTASAQVSFRSAAAPVGVTSGNLTISTPAGTVAGDVMLASIAVRSKTVDIEAGQQTNITHVGTGAHAFAASGNITLSLPTHTANDLLVCAITSNDNVPHSLPTGWTQVYQYDQTASFHPRASLWYRVATASGTPNPLVTHVAGGAINGGCSAFRGVSTSNPIDVAHAPSHSALGTDTLTLTSGSLTTVTNGALILFVGHVNNDKCPLTSLTTSGLIWAASFCHAYDSPSFDVSVALQYAGMGVAGEVGPVRFDTSGGADDNRAAIVALRPATPLNRAWTLIRSNTATSGGMGRLDTYYRIATASEPATHDFRFSQSAHAGAVGGILSFSGVSTSNPIDVSAGQNTPSSTSHTAPSVTTTMSGAMLVTSHSFGSARPWTPPAGMTERIDITSRSPDKSGISLEMNTQLRVTAGATGTRTAIASQDADTGATHSVALRPATAGGGCAALNGVTSISLIGVSPASTVAGQTTSVSFPLPAPTDTTATDLLVAQVAARRDNRTCTTITAPAGWTLKRTTTISGGKSGCLNQSIFYRFATAAAPYTFTTAHASYINGTLSRYRGVDPSAPVMMSSGQGARDSSNIIAPGVTTTRAGARLLGMFAMSDGLGVTMTVPECMTQQGFFATGQDTGVTTMLVDSPWATPSFTEHRISSANHTTNNVGQLLVLQPPGTTVAGAAFNAFDTDTPAGITGKIRTKVAGSPFSLAVIALNNDRTAVNTGYTQTVKIELIGNASPTVVLDANRCPTTGTVLHTGTLTFASADQGRKNYSVPALPDASPNVRVRVSHPSTGTATTVGCSEDNFALRPSHFTAPVAQDNHWKESGSSRMLNNASHNGGNVHAAGWPFRLSTMAVNSSGVKTPGYPGDTGAEPKAEVNCPAAGCARDGAGAAGELHLGSWQALAGDVVSEDATYSEAGVFALTLRDRNFAVVDIGDGTPDDCSGRHVCTSPLQTIIGRFVPDRLEFSFASEDGLTSFDPPQLQTFGATCSEPRTFTYVGQPFGFVTRPQAFLFARNAEGQITENYVGLTTQLTLTQNYLTTLGAVAPHALPASPPTLVTTSAQATLAEEEGGVARVEVPAGAQLRFSNTPSTPFTAQIELRLVVEDDKDKSGTGTNETLLSELELPLPFDGGNEFRFGRLRVLNGYTPVRQSLKLPARIEYCTALNGTGTECMNWASNLDDHCTRFSTLAGPASWVDLNPSGKTMPRCGVAEASCTNGSGLACNSSAAGAQVASGDVRLCLTAPTTDVPGYADILFAPPDYLSRGSNAGRGSFGIYTQTGKRRIIDRRELR